MDLVQAQPVFTINVTKSSNVLHSIAALEIDRAVLSPLEHGPATSICDLVTVHIKWFASVRKDVVHTRHVEAPMCQDYRLGTCLCYI